VDTPSLLTLYDKVRSGRKVRDDDTNPLIGVLRLAGITRSENGNLKLRNRIYERVFDRDWVLSNMPGAELRRQRVAFQRGIWRAAVVGIPIVLVAAGVVVRMYMREIAPPEAAKAPGVPPFWASFGLSAAAALNSGSLLVSAGEPDVAIFVGEQQYGRTAKDGTLQIDRLLAGSYTIRAQKPGLQSISLRVDIKPQLATPLNFKLQEQAQALELGSLLIQNAPAGADVSLDGRSAGVTSENGSFLLTAPPGEHTVRVAKDSFVPFEIKQQFSLGAKTSVDVQLKADAEMSRWKSLASSNDVAALRAYVHDYPNGQMVGQARERADLLEWNALKDRNDADVVRVLSEFVDRCRNAVCDQARARMNSLAAEDQVWIAASHSGDASQYQRYLASYPQGRYVDAARVQIAQLDKAENAQISEALQKYEEAYNQRDMNRILAIWPSLPAAAQKSARALFHDLKSFTSTISIGNIDRQGSVATVNCKRTLEFVGDDGGRGKRQDQVTYRLSKQSGHWLIDSIVH
jgi:hypothetical protein